MDREIRRQQGPHMDYVSIANALREITDALRRNELTLHNTSDGVRIDDEGSRAVYFDMLLSDYTEFLHLRLMQGVANIASAQSHASLVQAIHETLAYEHLTGFDKKLATLHAADTLFAYVKLKLPRDAYYQALALTTLAGRHVTLASIRTVKAECLVEAALSHIAWQFGSTGDLEFPEALEFFAAL